LFGRRHVAPAICLNELRLQSVPILSDFIPSIDRAGRATPSARIKSSWNNVGTAVSYRRSRGAAQEGHRQAGRNQYISKTISIMKKQTSSTPASLSRRDFNRLTAAAFGGVLLGTTLGAHAADGKLDPANMLGDKHVCRGLNTCKGKGQGSKNSCAGMGDCATAEKHSCGGENACKGQGGCEGVAGQNACKGQGKCEVPLKEKTWKQARAAFEKQMKKMGKAFGDAPKAKS
jgi:hypothetical protein